MVSSCNTPWPSPEQARIGAEEGGWWWHEAMVLVCLPLAAPIGLLPLHHGGWRQPMCDPEGCSTVWGAVGGGGGGPPPPSEGGGGPHPPPSLSQTQHLFRQAPSKRANTQS